MSVAADWAEGEAWSKAKTASGGSGKAAKELKTQEESKREKIFSACFRLPLKGNKFNKQQGCHRETLLLTPTIIPRMAACMKEDFMIASVLCGQTNEEGEGSTSGLLAMSPVGLGM